MIKAGHYRMKSCCGPAELTTSLHSLVVLQAVMVDSAVLSIMIGRFFRTFSQGNAFQREDVATDPGDRCVLGCKYKVQTPINRNALGKNFPRCTNQKSSLRRQVPFESAELRTLLKYGFHHRTNQMLSFQKLNSVRKFAHFFSF
eukprot:scaffold781_cov132-Cylindrotheca_fusiformis.AAC.19